MSPVLVPLTPANMPHMLAVRHRSITNLGHTYTPSQLAAWLSRDSQDSLTTTLHGRTTSALAALCPHSGNLIGFGIAVSNEVTKMFTDPSHIRQGIGSHILQGLTSAIGQKGHAKAIVDASLVAVPFYQTHGFRTQNTVLNTMPNGTTISTVLMVKNLMER
mgnify:CR=1 FL=1